jgi:hypothetical protein
VICLSNPSKLYDFQLSESYVFIVLVSSIRPALFGLKSRSYDLLIWSIKSFLKRKILILASRKCLFKPSKYPFLEIIYPTKEIFGIQSPENVYISHQKFPFLEILLSKKRNINI